MRKRRHSRDRHLNGVRSVVLFWLVFRVIFQFGDMRRMDVVMKNYWLKFSRAWRMTRIFIYIYIFLCKVVPIVGGVFCSRPRTSRRHEAVVQLIAVSFVANAMGVGERPMPRSVAFGDVWTLYRQRARGGAIGI